MRGAGGSRPLTSCDRDERGADRAVAAGDRKAAPHALWRAFGTQGAARRPTGDAVGGRRGRRDRGRAGGGARGALDRRQILRAQAAGAKAVSRASAARAGGDRGADELPLLRLDETVEARRRRTETLEVVPRQWKVIQTVRERFLLPAVRGDQPAAGAVPCHAARLRRPEPARDDPVREVRPASAPEPAERALRLRGIDLSLSTLADQVGACAAALRPLHALIERHVLAAERLHGDDTTVPILAKGRTVTGRVWVYVRDDRPFGDAF